MKKIRIKSQVATKLFEDDDITHVQQLKNTVDNNSQEIQDNLEYKGNLLQAFIKRSETMDIVKSLSVVQVKLSQNLFDNILFPKAPSQMVSLMCTTKMPKKFQNIYASYDDDPIKTIQKAEDKAEKYFYNIAEPPADEKDTLKSENASYRGVYTNHLNEDLPSQMGGALATGGKISVAIGKGMAIGGSFLAGLIPGLAAVYAAGGLAASGAEMGEWITDDRELHKKYSEETADVKSSQTAVYQAIDSYANEVMNVMTAGLKHITSGNADKALADLQKFIINILGSESTEAIHEFIKTNADKIEEDRKKEIKKLEKSTFRAKKQADELQNQIVAAAKDGFSQKSIQKLKNLVKAQQDDNDNYEFSSLNINNSLSSLNEADDTDDKSEPIIFDADTIYSRIVTKIRDHMVDVLNSKPEEWEIVKVARKQMEFLRDEATKEIEGAIKTVCRTANDGQMGLSSKLMSFVAKHPMRAGRLQNLWKRHETDLNYRIEQRLKQISELDGKGPLSMARSFYTETIPNLFGMLVIYKMIIQLYNNKTVFNANDIISSMATIQKSEGNTENDFNRLVNGFFEYFIRMFDYWSSEGGKISANKKPIHNGDNMDPNELNYLSLFLITLNDVLNGKINENIAYNKYQTLNEDAAADKFRINSNIDKINEILDFSAKLKSEKTASDFYTELIDYIIDTGRIREFMDLFKKTAQALDKTDTLEITNFRIYLQNNLEVFQKILQNKMAPLILKYIYATGGSILDNYTDNIFEPLINDKNNEELRENIKNQLGITNDLTVSDDMEKDAAETWLAASKYFENLSPDNLDDIYRIYYILKFNLYITKSNLGFFKLINQFVKLITDPGCEIIFGDDAEKQQLINVINEYNKGIETLDAYNTFCTLITDNDNAKMDKLSLSIAGINDNSTYEQEKISDRLFGTKSLFYNTKVNDEIVKKDYKNVGKCPINSWPIKIDIDFKFQPNSINELFALNSEKINKMQLEKDCVKTLKDFICYILQCELSELSQNTDIEDTFKTWAENETVFTFEDVNESFLSIINDWKKMYWSCKENKDAQGQVSIFETIITNADNKISNYFTDLKVSPTFMKLFLLSNKEPLFGTGQEFVDFVKANVKADGKAIGGKLSAYLNTLMDIFGNSDKRDSSITQWCSLGAQYAKQYKLMPKDKKKSGGVPDDVESHEKEHTGEPIEVPKSEHDDTEAKDESDNYLNDSINVLYYGYQTIYEDVKTILDDNVLASIPTPDGLKILSNIAGDETTTPIDNKGEMASTNPDIIDGVVYVADVAANQQSVTIGYSLGNSTTSTTNNNGNNSSAPESTDTPKPEPEQTTQASEQPKPETPEPE